MISSTAHSGSPSSNIHPAAYDMLAPVSEQVLHQAIDWQLRMGSGHVTAQDLAELDAWLHSHEQHARAWQQLGEIDQQFAMARPGPLRAVLVKRRTSRARRSTAAAALLGVIGLGLVLLEQHQPITSLLADYSTSTGEVRVIVLPDQSTIRLNSRSAVDVQFDAGQRLLVLRQGDVSVETSHANADEHRPFIVRTEQGSMRALGTRFVVERYNDATRLTVTQSAVATRPATCNALPETQCAQEQRIEQGESVVLRNDGLAAKEVAREQADAWKDGMLVVENQTLSEVAAQISRYRVGTVRVDPRIAQLRVTGTVPLANTDLALIALTAAQPVQVLYRTRFWVTLVPRE